MYEWGEQDRDADRRLAVAQSIPMHRSKREEVRKHYREAIAQEKGHFTAVDVPIPKGPSEHLKPTAMETTATRWLNLWTARRKVTGTFYQDPHRRMIHQTSYIVAQFSKSQLI